MRAEWGGFELRLPARTESHQLNRLGWRSDERPQTTVKSSIGIIDSALRLSTAQLDLLNQLVVVPAASLQTHPRAVELYVDARKGLFLEPRAIPQFLERFVASNDGGTAALVILDQLLLTVGVLFQLRKDSRLAVDLALYLRVSGATNRTSHIVLRGG